MGVGGGADSLVVGIWVGGYFAGEMGLREVIWDGVCDRFACARSSI